MGTRYCERCNVRCLTTLCGQCEEQDRIDNASSDAVASALAADRARIAAAVRWEMKLRPHFPKEPCEVVLARVLSLVEEKK